MERNTRVKRASKSNSVKVTKMPEIELSMSAYEIQGLLSNSRQLAKQIGERDITESRKKIYHQYPTQDEIRVKITHRELRLLAAFWVWAVFNTGEPTFAEYNLKILEKLLGSNDVNRIRQQVSDYERSKILSEQEDKEDDFDFPEEDFDTWRGR